MDEPNALRIGQQPNVPNAKDRAHREQRFVFVGKKRVRRDARVRPCSLLKVRLDAEDDGNRFVRIEIFAGVEKSDLHRRRGGKKSVDRNDTSAKVLKAFKFVVRHQLAAVKHFRALRIRRSTPLLVRFVQMKINVRQNVPKTDHRLGVAAPQHLVQRAPDERITGVPLHRRERMIRPGENLHFSVVSKKLDETRRSSRPSTRRCAACRGDYQSSVDVPRRVESDRDRKPSTAEAWPLPSAPIDFPIVDDRREAVRPKRPNR